METDKEIYRELCSTNDSIPLFLSYKWMNLVAKPDEWDVKLDREGKEVRGFWVYSQKKKFNWLKLSLPVLTPYSGIWYLHPPNLKKSKRLGFEKQVADRLLQSLPKFDLFHQTLHTNITYWLPMYWQCFKQTTRYTYILDTTQDKNSIFLNFKDTLRHDIKKAEKQYSITECSSNELYELKVLQHKLLPEKLPYDFTYLDTIIKSATAGQWGTALKAIDDKGKTHAAAFFVWDKNSMYYLIGTNHPETKTSGAASLLVWQGIQLAIDKNIPEFNFEGSMIKGVESFFRGFGGDPIPYFQITKCNSRVLQLLQFIRNK